MKKIFLMLSVVMFCGCATPPAQYDFESKETLTGSYDDVWSAVMETFAELNLSITTLEKDSGLVAAKAGGISENYSDCGKPGLYLSVGDRSVSFNVFVKSLDHETQKVTIASEYSAAVMEIMYGPKFSHMVWCNSTGLLEESMLASIKSKL